MVAFQSKAQRESEQRPGIGSKTELCMEVEIMNLIRDHGGSCSMVQIASALSGKNVGNTHANEGHHWVKTFINSIRDSMRIRASTAGVKRRYQLNNALERIKRAQGALDKNISTWPMAREMLSREMDFMEGHDAGEELAEQRQQQPHFLQAPSPVTMAFRHEESPPIVTSDQKWQQITSIQVPQKIGERTSEEKGAIERELELEQARREEEERKKEEEREEIERLRAEKEKEEEAKKAASSMLRDFTEEEEEMVLDAIHGDGPANEVMVQIGGESVTRASMQKLAPGQWVGDEAITCFLLGLAKRDEELCRADPSLKRSHFFNSFFITKLLNEGHDTKDGMYEYKNVKRWSKKVPGKDIFKLDKIIFPINQGRMHWVCAVVFMQEKRIQFYDSMGADGMEYLESLFQYIQDEHKAKHGGPLPDIDDWKLVPCTEDTPRQGNGFDCGVFLCTFADFVSMGYPLTFSQQHINKCRKRIALSILRGQAIV